MFGTGKSTVPKKCLDKKIIAQIAPDATTYNLNDNYLQKISSTWVYYRPGYSKINSKLGILEDIFLTFYPNEKYSELKLLEIVQEYPNPVCIMLDELAKILLEARIEKRQNPHQMQGYCDVLNAFRELSKICTVILAGKSPFLDLVGRGIYKIDGYQSYSLISFPDGLSGIEEVKKYLYFAIFSPDKLDLNTMAEINKEKIAVLDLFSRYCLYQVDEKKFIVPLLLFNQFSEALGYALAWSACTVTAHKTWEKLCCVAIAEVYKQVLPADFLELVAIDYALEMDKIFQTSFPKVVTKTIENELKTIHQNQVNSFLKAVQFPKSMRICQFGDIVDGLIDFGTNKFVVAIISKCYSQNLIVDNQFNPKFLETELKKLECFLAGKDRHYDTVLALFVAPFLNSTFNDAKGKVFRQGSHHLSQSSHKLPHQYLMELLC